MARAMLDRYLRWFEYERDAHQKVIRSIESIPVDRHTSPEYHKAVDLFAHVVAARRLWLGRLGVLPPLTGAVFPKNVRLAQVVEECQMVEQEWESYYRRLTDEEIQKTFQYTSIDNRHFLNRIEDVLTQLFGHSWYHRGQIAVQVRAASGEPAVTDFIYWCREAIESSQAAYPPEALARAALPPSTVTGSLPGASQGDSPADASG